MPQEHEGVFGVVMIEILRLRDEFASDLKEVPGIVSVGIGRSGREVVLVVAVDRDQFKGSVPERYKGVNVRVQELGVGQLHRTLPKGTKKWKKLTN